MTAQELFVGGIHPLIRCVLVSLSVGVWRLNHVGCSLNELDHLLSFFGEIVHLSLPLKEQSWTDQRRRLIKNRG